MPVLGRSPIVEVDEHASWVAEVDMNEEFAVAMHNSAATEYLELGHLASLGHLVEVRRNWGARTMERSETYNNYWKRIGVDQLAAGSLGTASDHTGLVSIARVGPDVFTDEELEAAERLIAVCRERLAVMATTTIASAESEHGLDPLVRALSALPLVAAYFAPDGRMRWLSHECQAWAESLAMPFGGRTLIVRRGDRLSLLAAFAQEVQSEPTRTLGGGEPRWRQALGPHQRLVARRVPPTDGDPGGVLVCVREEAPIPAEVSLEPDRLVGLGLTPRESDVAALSAQGYSLKNTAARLGIAETTVHTHLKRVYRKLCVFSRAELCYRLLTGDPPTGAGAPTR
jgi:DNA-binding CsgD family transcriptional regulator